MPTIQDMPLEIQNMIMKHLNARSIHGQWIEWKLYKGDGIVNAIYPFFHLVRNNVGLSYRESMRSRFTEDLFMPPCSVGKPYIVSCNKSPPPIIDSDDDY